VQYPAVQQIAVNALPQSQAGLCLSVAAPTLPCTLPSSGQCCSLLLQRDSRLHLFVLFESTLLLLVLPVGKNAGRR
jgi:hypothetical protein